MALSTSPKRVTFDLSNELIEQLLSKFDQKGFNKLVKKQCTAVSFVLPDIILTNKKKVCEFGIEDLLGAYQMKSLDTPDEGNIVIYYESIWETVVEYLAENSNVISSKVDCFDALTCIVTIHELVHWLMHYVIEFVPLQYSKDNEIEFHEGFAQLLTWLTIKNVPDEDGELLQNIFSWLTEGQPKQYSIFKEFKNENSEDLIDFEEAIELLKFFVQYKIQHFESSIIPQSLSVIELKRKNDTVIDIEQYRYWIGLYRARIVSERISDFISQEHQANFTVTKKAVKYGL